MNLRLFQKVYFYFNLF